VLHNYFPQRVDSLRSFQDFNGAFLKKKNSTSYEIKVFFISALSFLLV
jgi:hypothetical protein